MNILLDTCDAIWFLAGDERLSAAYREAFANPQNQLFLSVVSDWEIAIKHSIGKLHLKQSPKFYLIEGRRRLSIQSLPLFPEPTYALEDLPKHHNDPFDRIIICQALVHGLVLASSDPLVRQYPVNIL